MRISRQGYNGPPSARASVRLRRRSRRGVATERREGRIVSDVAGAAAVPIGRTSLAVAGSPAASYAYTQRKGKECLARRETFYRLTEGRQAGRQAGRHMQSQTARAQAGGTVAEYFNLLLFWSFNCHFHVRTNGSFHPSPCAVEPAKLYTCSQTDR